MSQVRFPSTPGGAYDRRTIIFHWLTAALVAVQWVGAHYIDAFPRGPLRVDARSAHIVIGVALVVVLLSRLAWRMTKGARLERIGPPRLSQLARLTHWLLYGLLAATLTAGLLNAWVRGDSLFGLFHLPSFAPGDKALRGQVGAIHDLLADWLLIVAGAHAFATIAHQLIWKDRVLARMVPGLAPRP